MHHLLQRQIKRALDLAPDDWARLKGKLESWADQVAETDPDLARGLFGLPTLIDRVSEAYEQQERDLALVRRSLELSSSELSTANLRLGDEARTSTQALQALQQAFDALHREAGGGQEDTSGNLLGLAEQIALLTRDQTRMRQALAKSEERFDLAMRGSNDGLWDYDVEAGSVYYSPRWKAMLGHVEHEIGSSLDEWSGRVHPEDLPKAQAAISDHFAGRSDHFEAVFRFRHKDGHYLWILSRGIAVRDAASKAVRMVGTHTDISQHIALEHHLAQFKNAIDEHAIVSITDIHGDITYANSKFVEISGYSEPELLGNNHRLLKSGAHPDSFYSELWQTISSGQTWVGEICNRAKDGHLYWVLATIAPMLDAQGLPYQYIAIRADITQSKESEAELIQAKEMALAASRMKSEFLANMSHEIRTPMNGVLGMLALTLDTQLNEEQREYLTLANTSADNLLHILNDILDLSKIEAGRLDIHGEDLVLHALVNEIARLSEPRCREKGLKFVLSLDSTLPEQLHADPVRIRQVLQNLLSNALKFTAQGHITLSVQHAQGGIRFSVRDTGIGIPFDKQSSIFMAFTQADGSITKRFGGTGLGLTISSRLVQMMGGRIGLESIPGHGSEFFFSLPLSAAHQGTSRLTTLVDAGLGTRGAKEHGPSLDILLAEDNPINQKLTVALLTRVGHRVTVADSGIMALELLAQQRFDILLMDVQMPGPDGLETTRRIRAREGGGSHLPIVALTANAYEQDRERCLAAGMDGFVTKPIRRDELFAAISAALGQRPGG